MKTTKQKGVAFLWDESFLWGLMAYKALKGAGLPFDLVRSGDIQAGVLEKYKMLFVPGGWASNKSKALGKDGIKAIQNFVENGGSYLGFCGGAGLATKAKGGIGLLSVKRRPTKERVPSFSGRIHLNVKDHMIWNGFGDEGVSDSELRTQNSELVFQAWWPSQLVIEDNNVKILATYGNALPDSFSSDLNVGDVELNGNWAGLEKVYHINLDPKRLLNEPSVIESLYGKGKVVLSLVHFDTPDDIKGQQVLKNLWEYLANETSGVSSPAPSPLSERPFAETRFGTGEGRGGGESLSSNLYNLCSELISLGERNFLWFWRNSMLLQWRRGVRGLEYNTLYILMREIAEIIKNQSTVESTLRGDPTRELRTQSNRPFAETRLGNSDKGLEKIKTMLIPFLEKAKRLLILERHAMQRGHITYEKCDDPEIKEIRSKLFSDSKSHGGMFKELIDEFDKLLFELIRRN